MRLNRRTFSGMLLGAASAPRGSFAQATKARTAFYSGVGTELTNYAVDADTGTLERRSTVKMPGGIQYAWPSPSRKFLYVTSSTGGPGFSGNEHHLAAFRVDGEGALTPHGDPVKLNWRPIHNSVDVNGEYVLVAYNFPSGFSVHRIKADGSIGDAVTQADTLEKGIYFHQIRATPGNKSVIVVARGNNPEGGKPEDPGSLHVYGFKDGRLSNMSKVAPNGGYGYGPRHLDIHPSKPWVYLSVERQNKLIVYKLKDDGDLAPEPLFTRETLADPAHRFPVQGAGPIHVAPAVASSISATARALPQKQRRASRTSTARRCSAAERATSPCLPSIRRPASRAPSSTPTSAPPIPAPSRSIPRGGCWLRLRWRRPRFAGTTRSSPSPQA